MWEKSLFPAIGQAIGIVVIGLFLIRLADYIFKKSNASLGGIWMSRLYIWMKKKSVSAFANDFVECFSFVTQIFDPRILNLFDILTTECHLEIFPIVFHVKFLLCQYQFRIVPTWSKPTQAITRTRLKFLIILTVLFLYEWDSNTILTLINF